MPIDLLTSTLAVEALRECLCDGQVKPTRHFREELDKEAITFADVWYVLRCGCIFDPAELDIKTGEWKYKIEGKTPDGIWTEIVFCIKSADRINLITVFCGEVEKGQIQ